MPIEPQRDFRILVVEDNPADVRLLEEYLDEDRERRFAVETAETLKEALVKVREESFDVVVLDLILPDSSGLDTFRTFQTESPNLPVIVMTRLDQEEVALGALREGAQDYMTKGALEPEALSRSIRYALERHRTLYEEFGSLRSLAMGPPTAVTANTFGLRSLKAGNPEVFDGLCATYAEILAQALEEKAFKVDHSLPGKLQDLADRLGYYRAGPRDVIDLHSEVLRRLTAGANFKKVQAYVDEGRMTVLRLMGYLVLYYRNHSLGIPRRDDADHNHTLGNRDGADA